MTTLEQNLTITIFSLAIIIMFLTWYIIWLLIRCDKECNLCTKKIKKKNLMNLRGKTNLNDKLRTMSFHTECIAKMIQSETAELIDHSDELGELQLGDYKLYILHNKEKKNEINEK